jgi:hypothetical protein
MAIGDEYAISSPQSTEQLQHILNQCRSPKLQRRKSSYSVSSASSTGSSFDSRLVAINRDDRRPTTEPIKYRETANIPKKAPWQDPKELYAAIA